MTDAPWLHRCYLKYAILRSIFTRPCGEIQEVVYYPRQQYTEQEKLKCTYIEIDQVESTHAGGC